MTKKAVSPLIAAILLIALTVSIGAMIIGWGRQYVQQQTKCLGASATISYVEVDANKSKMNVTIENTGTQPIIAKNIIFYVYDVNGQKQEITANDTAQFSVGGTNTQVLRPGQTGTITVVDNKTLKSCDDVLSVELAVQGCGIISNSYSVYNCKQ